VCELASWARLIPTVRGPDRTIPARSQFQDGIGGRNVSAKKSPFEPGISPVSGTGTPWMTDQAIGHHRICALT